MHDTPQKLIKIILANPHNTNEKYLQRLEVDVYINADYTYSNLLPFKVVFRKDVGSTLLSMF